MKDLGLFTKFTVLSLLLMFATLCAQGNTNIAEASDVDMKLRIRYAPCTVDQTYSYGHPNYIFQPSYCREAVDNPNTPNNNRPTADEPKENDVANQDSQINQARPGNQGALENTIFEALAHSIGIGSTTVSPAQPILFAGFIIGSASLAVDTLLFDRRFTKQVSRSLRSKIFNK